MTNSILLTLAAIAGFLTQAKRLNQPEGIGARESVGLRDSEGLLRKARGAKAWRIQARPTRSNSAAARRLWTAGLWRGDRSTVPALGCGRRQDSRRGVQPMAGAFSQPARTRAALLDATTGAQSAIPCGTRMKSWTRPSVLMARIATASKDRTARLWDAAT